MYTKLLGQVRFWMFSPYSSAWVPRIPSGRRSVCRGRGAGNGGINEQDPICLSTGRHVMGSRGS